jgi:hypothetical protein
LFFSHPLRSRSDTDDDVLWLVMVNCYSLLSIAPASAFLLVSCMVMVQAGSTLPKKKKKKKKKKNLFSLRSTLRGPPTLQPFDHDLTFIIERTLAWTFLFQIVLLPEQG